MAVTVAENIVLRMVPWEIRRLKLTGLTADATETISHGGPTGLPVSRVFMEIITPPTVLTAFTPMHLVASDSTSNNTIAMKFVAAPGGDLDGAEVYLYVEFFHAASGGIS